MNNKVTEPENEEEDNMQTGDKKWGHWKSSNNQALDTDLRPEVDNFPDHFFTLELKKTRSLKHKKQDIINEHSYMRRIRDTVITDPPPTLEEITPNLRALFTNLLEEINHAYRPNDLVRVFITHEEMVNTNIIVGPDFLHCITVELIMDVISDVIRSNNYIPADLLMWLQ